MKTVIANTDALQLELFALASRQDQINRQLRLLVKSQREVAGSFAVSMKPTARTSTED